ncbi:uncharacterized protein C3orf86 homolog [Mastomys coucha]|uniref:uncharacterized protein C3orf86 homolog n=1 Tax=Mastomys coucha TaxID=35658 RepID=UPI001261FBF8|nr:uncharacterized protein C3orf86 homolog [Mastomys coucha]
MSRSQLEQEKKCLDSFVWVNEITGEVTFPPGEETTPAASGEKRRARSGSLRVSMPCAVHRSSSPVNPESRGRGAGSLLLPDLAVPRARSPPGAALPTQHHLGASHPLAAMLPASLSPPWALSCKLKNLLTGNNRFSF